MKTPLRSNIRPPLEKNSRSAPTSAYLNESPGIHFSDCLLMSACLWDEVSQLPIIENIVESRLHGESIHIYWEKNDWNRNWIH